MKEEVVDEEVEEEENKDEYIEGATRRFENFCIN